MQRSKVGIFSAHRKRRICRMGHGGKLEKKKEKKKNKKKKEKQKTKKLEKKKNLEEPRLAGKTGKLENV